MVEKIKMFSKNMSSEIQNEAYQMWKYYYTFKNIYRYDIISGDSKKLNTLCAQFYENKCIEE